MLENIKAVLFDLDGTLIDSMGLWGEIDRKFFAEYGIDMPSDLANQIGGMSMRETAEYFHDVMHFPCSVESMLDRWNQQAYQAYRYDLAFKPGAENFLKLLKERNIKTAIATSNSTELVDAVYENLGLSDYIDLYVTSHEVPRGKPSPDVYLLAAKRLDVSPEDCLVFEDILPGIQAGKSAGMKVCTIFDEHSRGDEKKKQDLADYYIHDFNDLKGI